MSKILLNRENLLSNLATIQKLSPNCIVAPCLKSNAYGHGLVEIATTLSKSTRENQANKNSKDSLINSAYSKACSRVFQPENQPKDSTNQIKNIPNKLWFTLSSVKEAVLLRKKIPNPILILNSLNATDIKKALKMEEIRLSLYSFEIIRLADKLTIKAKKTLKVHLQIDTGMHWLGILPSESLEAVRAILNCPFLELEGVWTHFASSENLEMSYFSQQLSAFLEVKNEIVKIVKNEFQTKIKIWHCANSGAVLRDFPEKHEFNLVQPGKILYGSYVTGTMKKISQEKGIILRPVLSWQTKISQIKKLKKGETIGYDQTYICPKDCQIAILPVGYWDGINRKVSGQGYVLIGGWKCNFVGRICMNLSMVLLPEGITNFKVGQTVVLIGEQEKTVKKEIPPKNLAKSKIVLQSNSQTNLQSQNFAKKESLNLKNNRSGEENSQIESIPLGLVASWCETIGREISVKINPKIKRIIV